MYTSPEKSGANSHQIENADPDLKKILEKRQKELLNAQKQASLSSLEKELETDSKNPSKKHDPALKVLFKDRLSIYIGVALSVFMIVFSAVFFLSHIRIPPLPKNFKNFHKTQTVHSSISSSQYPSPVLYRSAHTLTKYILEEQRVLTQMQESVLKILNQPKAFHPVFLAYLTEYSQLNADLQKKINRSISSMKKASFKEQTQQKFNDLISQSIELRNQQRN